MLDKQIKEYFIICRNVDFTIHVSGFKFKNCMHNSWYKLF